MHKIDFIVNMTAQSGKSAVIWKKIEEVLIQEKIAYELHDSKYKGYPTELARKLSISDKDKVYLIVIGGDGTINEVLNGITDFNKIRLGVIPAGSGNDFARGTGIKKGIDGFHDILNSIKKEENDEKVSRIDLGKITWSEKDNILHSRLFGISAGIGMDAIVCKKALNSKQKKFLNMLHLGQLSYILLTIETLFSMKTAEADIRLSDGRMIHASKMIYLAAMNLFAEGGGVPMAPNAGIDDGNLVMCCAHKIPKILTFFCLPLLMMAKHEKLNGFMLEKFTEMELCISEPMTVHTDGEYCGEIQNIRFECLKQQLILLK